MMILSGLMSGRITVNSIPAPPSSLGPAVHDHVSSNASRGRVSVGSYAEPRQAPGPPHRTIRVMCPRFPGSRFGAWPNDLRQGPPRKLGSATMYRPGA